jgi:hypothetical protein
MTILSRTLLMMGVVLMMLAASLGSAHAQLCGACLNDSTAWISGVNTVTTTGPPSCTILYFFKYRINKCGVQEVNIDSFKVINVVGPCASRPFNPQADLLEIRHDLLIDNPMGFFPSSADIGCRTVSFYGASCFHYRFSSMDSTIIYDPCVNPGCCGVVYRICSNGMGNIAATTTSFIFSTGGDTCAISSGCLDACPSQQDTLLNYSSSPTKGDPSGLSSIVPRPTVKQGRPIESPASAPDRQPRYEMGAPRGASDHRR